MFNIISKYLNWLQKDVPTGVPSQVPSLTKDGETSHPGVYIIGDLTGIPLLKLAANSGVKTIKTIARRVRKSDIASGDFDVVIIGAGPAGVEAGIQAKRKGLRYLILESSNRAFNTIEDFPKGKSMFFEPKDLEELGKIKMVGNKKEDFLLNLNQALKDENLNIEFEQRVLNVASENDLQLVETGDNSYKTRYVVVAMGKTGNYRHLGVEGEDLPHVFYKLFDPAEYKDSDVLVIGGGDSAAESAILLEEAGARVVLNYYGKELSKPKAKNIEKVDELSKEGKLAKIFETNVEKIEREKVFFDNGQDKAFDNVFIFIGSEPPFAFLKNIGVKLENEKSKNYKWWLFFSISIFNIIYFGKWSQALDTNLLNVFSGDLGTVLVKLLAWLSLLFLIASGVVVMLDLVKQRQKYFSSGWLVFRNTYFFLVIIFYVLVFVASKYYAYNIFSKDPYFWYSFLYTLTIGVFGLARVIKHKTKYISYQATVVFLIQLIPLFIIPNFVLPYLDSLGLISEWVKMEIFLGGEWWRFVGFILAWPLFIWNLFTAEPSIFWLIVSLLQTFVIIPCLVYMWGKGAYCSWICSCGAMAETLGDEHRSKAWRGKSAKNFERWGQLILLIILLLTILHYLSFSILRLEELSKVSIFVYQLLVDTTLAGVVGFGLYFFYSGRVWCRFFCPLAALMHIYNKFSRWTINADKRKCISCGLCTRNCHMGIDVMSYAERGKDVTDVECVNCSACVEVCPVGVLSFAKKKKK